MSIPKQILQNVLDQVSKKIGLDNWSYELTKSDTPINDNYFGIIVPVVLSGHKDGKFVDFHIILKQAPFIEELKGTFIINMFYNNEILTYTTLRNLFKEFNVSFNLKELVPECYFVNETPDKELLVIEDMRRNGFKNFNGRYLDLQHSVLTLKSIAQFHALSMAVYNKNNFVFDNVPEFFNKPYQRSTQGALTKYSYLFSNTKFAGFMRDVETNYYDMANRHATKQLYCGHGDVHTGNLVFKYVNNVPIRSCLLDYQQLRMMSPAQDVLHFLLGSVDPNVRKNHHHDLLHAYLNTLHKVLTETGLDPNRVYSKSDFEKDLKLVTPLTFSSIFMSFVLWLGLLDFGVVTSKQLCTTDDEKNTNEDNFKSIIMDIFQYLDDFNYITT